MTPEQFKAARESAGLSRTEMARAMGYCGYSRVYAIERGARGISGPAVRLARLLAGWDDVELIISQSYRRK